VTRALWVVLFLCAAASARAADDDSPEKAQARVLLSQGNALFERGDLRGALVDFRAAYALYPSPKLLVNVAAAERELGDLPGAANDLRHFLDDASEEEPGLVERARADLRALDRRTGRLQLVGWPPHTALDVDGRLVRDPVYVRPGEHHVRVHGPGGLLDERDLEIDAGETVDLPMPAHVTRAALPRLRRTDATPPPRRGRGWIAAVVIGSLVVVGGAIALGVVLGSPSSPAPLKGDLGIYKFSDFH
jgi:hypothetical protein